MRQAVEKSSWQAQSRGGTVVVCPRIRSTDLDVSCCKSVKQAHPPAPRQKRLSYPDERPQPATAPHQVWCVDVYCGHRRAACDDTAGQRRDRGAAGGRGTPRPPTHAGALAPGHARPRAPAAVTVSRHLSNISVTVGPLGPAIRPRTTRLRPLLVACSTPCGDGAGPGLNVAWDVPMCCLVAFCVLAWARHDRQRLRSRHTPGAPSDKGRSWALPAPERLRRAASPLIYSSPSLCGMKRCVRA
jgi:hypothetical protein